MKKIIYITAVLLLISVVRIQAQNTVCMLDTLPSSINTNMKLTKILIDNSGNLFIGGFYRSGIGGNYTGGSMNFLLQKYSPSKQLLWEQLIIPTQTNNYMGSYLTGLDLDNNGNIYVSGSSFGSKLSLDTITINFPYASSNINRRHSFVAKFNSSGSIQWLVYTNKINSYDPPFGLTSDLKYVDDQHIYISMDDRANLLFTNGISHIVGGDFSMFTINSNGEFVSNFFASSTYSPTAKYRNVAQGMPPASYTGKKYGIRPKICLSNSGEAYLTSYFVADKIAVGSQKIACYHKNSYTKYYTNVVVKVDSNNSPFAFRGMGSLYQTSSYHPTPFALDNSENVYLAAEWSNNEIIIDSNNIPQSSEGTVITKYDKNGNILWYSISSLCHIYELHMDKNNNVVVVGEYEDSIRITPPVGTSQTLIASNNNQSVFTYSLGKDGSIKGMIDIHGTYDSDYMGSYLNDCGTLTILAKCNGNTYMGTTGMVNNMNNVIIAKTSPYSSCSSSNCKYLYLKDVKKQMNNCNYSNISIKWKHTAITSINFYYSLDSGTTYTLGSSNIPAVLGQYNWTPPSVAQNTALRIKIAGVGADSLFSDYYDISPRISGTKTIGGINPDYTSFKSAFDDISKYGICSDVTFKVRNGVYDEQISFSTFSGMTQYHVSFEAESANNPSVILQDSTYDYSFPWFLEFKGIQNMSFKNIKFFSRLFNNALIFKTAKINGNIYSKDIMFDSCEFNYLIFDGKSLIIKNSNFLHPYKKNFSFKINGISGDTLGNNFQMYNNTFSNYSGLVYQKVSNLDIHNNIFRDSSFITIYEGLQNINIYNNKVVKSEYLWLNLRGQDAQAHIYNNCISRGLISTGFVISTYQNKKVEINNNSFRGSSYSLIKSTNCEEFHMINNVFTTKGTYPVLEINNLSNHTILSDYNNFHSYYFIKHNGHYYTNLSDWQTASNQDLHSTSLDPLYVNDTILHIHNIALENMGTPISYIKYDIDGDLRSPFTPDIGAYEFSLTSIADNNTIFDLKLYPNPASTKLTIEVSEESLKIEKLDIYNSQAKLVLSININHRYNKGETYTIDISKLVTGIYFLQIKTEQSNDMKVFNVIK